PTFERGGFIVTNRNCSVTGLVLALKPLVDAFDFDRVHVATYQALSGAGYPGVPSLDIEGNVLPFIDQEEEKMRREAKKLLGRWSGGIVPSEIEVWANCARVTDRVLRFFLLSHNTIRGGAGGSVLNAELAHRRGYLG